MRKQIRGLDKASSNAEDGVSAVQTAEGALTEVHSMLQRMNELATQAANGTNSKDTDRKAIQDEIDQLTTEIDRVSETTKFNETYLLKGDGTKGSKTVNAHDAGLAGKLSNSVDGKTTFTADALSIGDKVKIAGTEYNIVDSSKAADYQSVKEYADAATATPADYKGDKLIRDGVTYTHDGTATGFVSEDGTAIAVANIKDGDTLVTNGEKKTFVGNANANLSTPAKTDTWTAGDKITAADGTTYTYYAANATGTSVAGFYANTPGKQQIIP